MVRSMWTVVALASLVFVRCSNPICCYVCYHSRRFLIILHSAVILHGGNPSVNSSSSAPGINLALLYTTETPWRFCNLPVSVTGGTSKPKSLPESAGGITVIHRHLHFELPKPTSTQPHCQDTWHRHGRFAGQCLTRECSSTQRYSKNWQTRMTILIVI